MQKIKSKIRFIALVFHCLMLGYRTEAQMAIPRGRPHLNAARTTFVGDNGQNLRGPFTSTEWTGAVPAQNIANMKALGFNAIHLYAESFDPTYPTNGTPGYAVSRVDSIVAATRTNGLYLVMTIGNGAYNGSYNLAYVTNFWAIYSARYANETHVLFEIQNEPVAWGPSYLTSQSPPGAVNMEIAAYRTIRANAPNTPVLLFSYAVFNGSGGASAALTDIRAFNTNVFGSGTAVWTNEAVAFHGYGAGAQSTATAVSNLISAGYPCLMTEYAGSLWGNSHGGFDVAMTSELERLGVSWLTFQYVPPTGVSDDITKPDVYSNVVLNAGLSWSPDYGSFPNIRGPYGNGGQPRTVPASYVNNFLTGTPLRVQAEDFDTGGEGVAYHELTTNLGGQYRTNETVDVETTTDTSGGYAVGATAAGEWLEYTIKVPVAGYYNLSLRYAAPSSGCAVQVTGNGHDRTGPWALPSTGSSTTWMTATQQVLLEPGRQKMRLTILNGGLNLNWFELTPASTGVFPNGVYKFLNAANGLVFTATTSTNLVGASNYVGLAYQQWNLQHIGGGQYKITSAANGWSWNLNNDGSLGSTSGWDTGDHKCFILMPTSGGYLSILPVANGLPFESVTSTPNAIDQQVSSGAANQQWALAVPSAPMFPTGLKVSATSATQVSLTWNTVSNATGYNFKRSAARGGPYITMATGVTATNYTDTVPVGMRYYYVVSAVAAGVESPNSLEATYLLYPWLTQDIGAVGITGGVNYSNGVFAVNGSGADIWGTADAFRFVYVPVTGNCTMIVRVISVQNVDAWSKAGIMIRESLNANAANTYIAVTPGNGVTWQYRTSTGGNSGYNNITGLTAPYWVRLVRNGNTFTGSRSPDGTNWTQLGTTTFTMASTAYIGLALTAHNNSSLCAATFDNITGPNWANPRPATPPASLAAIVTNWNISLAWPGSGGATSYNVKRAVTYGGPYTVLANVPTTNYTDIGLVNDTDYYYVVSALNVAGEGADSPQAAVAGQIFTPSGLSVTPIASSQIRLVWYAFPNATSYNVKRSSTSGGPYVTIATGVATTNFTDSAPAGVAYYYVVSALSNGAETPNSPEATCNLPYPWLTQDIGALGIAGHAVYSNDVFTVGGAGADIQGTADAFRFVYTSASGNCTIIARVSSVQNIDSWSKAGVMIRESLAANAANAFVALTPSNGVTWQYRSSAGGGTTYNNTTGLSAPYWVKLVRSGNTFTGYRSPDGTNWTQQGSATFTMAANTLVGLALTSHNNASLGTATFDNVTAPNWQAWLEAPASLIATAGDMQVMLSWAASSEASSYDVKRATTNGGPYTVIRNVTATNYTDTGLINGTNYYYVVSARNTYGESTDSVQVTARPWAPPTLSVSLAGTNLMLSWPVVPVIFVLQSRTNLALGGWENVTSPSPRIISNQWQITLPVDGQKNSTYYRLIK